MAGYLFGATRLGEDDPRVAAALAAAHAERLRPRCLCMPEGTEMYVARLGDRYIAKRMPGTGSRHATDCPSYEPPQDDPDSGRSGASAITHDPVTGATRLALGFPLSIRPARSTSAPAARQGSRASSRNAALSLRGLLHYLWDEAELTRWHPGFAGKRNWGIVRHHLLRAAEHKFVRGEVLRDLLYVPEVFSVEERDAINARRLAKWQRAVATPGRPQRLILLVAEVKEIAPARHGFKMVVKHVPDQVFAIDEQVYPQLGRSFAQELAVWGDADDIHMMMIATFAVRVGRVPAIHELSLLPVNRQWLPVHDALEKQLIEQLVDQQRSFVTGLYPCPSGSAAAGAT